MFFRVDTALNGLVTEVKESLIGFVQAAIERTGSHDGRMAHLDGIRAIALSGVLAFHFGVGFLPGGFLGVDIFFVLSGFLMTRNILSRKLAGSFSFKNFIQARALRICPALFATILATMVASVYIFPKNMILGISRSSIAATTFSSNVNFMMESGYHDTSSMTKPLLHTWSLAVEGQFYILWSLLAMIFEMEALVAWMSVLSVGSLLFNIFGQEMPVAMFFLTPSRLYQFFAGSLALALYDLASPRRSNLLQMIGLIAVILSFIFVTAEDGPIFLTSLPIVVGTTMIIASPKGLLSGPRFLGGSVLCYIGKISYSTYLVHWPSITLSAYLLSNAFLASATSIALTAILSPVLYNFVEEEFRVVRQKARAHRGVLFCLLLASCIFAYVSICLLGARRVILNAQGIHSERSQQGMVLPTAQAYRTEIDTVLKDLRARGIIVPDHPSPAAYTMIVGDSYAKNILGMIEKSAEKKNATEASKNFFFASSNACMFTTAGRVKASRAKYVRTCEKDIRQAFAKIKKDRASKLVLSARWRDYIDDPEAMKIIAGVLRDFAAHADILMVIGVIPRPRNPRDPLACLWKNVDEESGSLVEDTSLRCPREFDIDPEDLRHEIRLKEWLRTHFPSAQYVSPLESRLCRKSESTYTCRGWDPSKGSYYHDGLGHLTVVGALEATNNVEL